MFTADRKQPSADRRANSQQSTECAVPVPTVLWFLVDLLLLFLEILDKRVNFASNLAIKINESS